MSRLRHLHRKFVFLMLCFVATIVRAQYEGTTWEQRIGTGSDAETNRAQISLWTNYTTSNQTVAWEHGQDKTAQATDYEKYPRTWNKESYDAWNHLIHNAPYSLFSLYSSGAGGDMLRYLMYTEPDPAVKMIYFQDLMTLSQLRVANLAALNSIPKESYGPPTKSKPADVMTWKAHYYYTEGRQLAELWRQRYGHKGLMPDSVYSPLQAYKLFSDAMGEVRRQGSADGTEVEPYLIQEYFNSCYDLYQTDTLKYYEQFLQDYLDCESTCRRMCETPDENQFAKYFNTMYYRPEGNSSNAYSPGLCVLFEQTKANTEDNVDGYFAKTFEQYKDDPISLNKALALMLQFGDAPRIEKNKAVDKYARLAYQNQDKLTYYSAVAYALLKKKEADETYGDSLGRVALRKEMVEAFNHAKSLAKTNKEKAQVCYIIAQALEEELDPALATMRDEVENWRDSQQNGVIKHCQQAADYDPDHYAAASNLLAARTYVRIMNAFNAIKRDGLLQDRMDIRDLAIKGQQYAQQAIKDAEYSSTKHIWQQCGKNLGTIVSQANTALTNSNNYATAMQNYLHAYNMAAAKNAANRAKQQAAQAAYDAYMKKKKAEENFWLGK